MPEAFDPYHRWLGIPPKDQPPTHYRLLGIEEFESDPEVIRDAAQRQMAHVRRYQLGQNSVLSQEILNRLGAAKACLSDPVRRAAYDEALRTKRAAVAAVATPPPKAPVVSGESSLTRSIYGIAEDPAPAHKDMPEQEFPAKPDEQLIRTAIVPPPIPVELAAKDAEGDESTSPAPASAEQARRSRMTVMDFSPPPPAAASNATPVAPSPVPAKSVNRGVAVNRAVAPPPMPHSSDRSLSPTHDWRPTVHKEGPGRFWTALLVLVVIVTLACALLVWALR